MTGFLSMFVASVMVMGLITLGFPQPSDETYARAKPSAAMMLAWHEHAIAATKLAENVERRGRIPESDINTLMGNASTGCVGAADRSSTNVWGSCPFASFTDGTGVLTVQVRAIASVDGKELLYYLNEYTHHSPEIGWIGGTSFVSANSTVVPTFTMQSITGYSITWSPYTPAIYHTLP